MTTEKEKVQEISQPQSSSSTMEPKRVPDLDRQINSGQIPETRPARKKIVEQKKYSLHNKRKNQEKGNSRFSSKRPTQSKRWLCPECQFKNYLNNKTCFSCKKTVPSSPQLVDFPSRTKREKMPLHCAEYRHGSKVFGKRDERKGSKWRDLKENCKVDDKGASEGQVYKLIPQTQAIYTKYTYAEIENAVKFLNQVKEVKKKENHQAQLLTLVNSFSV